MKVKQLMEAVTLTKVPPFLSSPNPMNPERISGPSLFLYLPSSAPPPAISRTKLLGKICPYSLALMSALAPESALACPKLHALSCLPKKGTNNAAAH